MASTATRLLHPENPQELKIWADKIYEALRGGAMGRVQRGVIVITGATDTATATVEEVDPTTAELHDTGQYNNQNSIVFNAYLTLTNSTTITAKRGSATSGVTTIGYELRG